MNYETIKTTDSPETGDAMPKHRNRWGVLTEFFSFLEDHGVEYALLGDVNEFPAIEGDVDLVVSGDTLARLGNILLTFAKENGCSFVQSIRHEGEAYFNTLSWKDGSADRKYLQLDICADYKRSGRLLMGFDTLLRDRRRIQIEDATVYVPSPAASFCYYAVKKIEKGDCGSAAKEFLRGLLAEDADAVEQIMTPILGQEMFASFREVLLSSEAQSSLDGYQEKVRAFSRRNSGMREVFAEWRRRIDRIVHPNGMLIALFGPDGSGKSTINAGLRDAVAPAFWSTGYMHLRPNLGGSDSDSQVVTDPHGLPPRSWIASVVKIIYYWVDYVAGYALKIWPKLVQTRFVASDRYYYDIVVDPRRYRYGGPAWLTQLVARVIPRPHLILVLDAPTEVIQSRKQEVSPEETERQRSGYLELSNRYGGHVIDADQSPSDVIADAEDIVVKFLHHRMTRRLGSRT